jgi:hypothetical protein
MARRDDFEQANERAKDLKMRVPRAVSAHYDRKTGRIVVRLSSRLIVSFLTPASPPRCNSHAGPESQVAAHPQSRS